MPTNREISIKMTLRDRATAAFKRASTVWGRSLTRIRQAAGALMRRLKLLAVIGIAMVTAAFVKGIKSAIRYGLQLDKLSKLTGVNVKELGKLIYAIEQEHGNQEALAKGLMSLVAALGYAGEGMASYIRYFETLNIVYRDNEGRLITADKLLLKLSDRLSQAKLSTEEMHAVQMLLGKRIARELIPFLKKGRDYIKEMGDEAKILGIIMTAETVVAMKRFDDKLTAVKAGLKGVWLGIAQGLLPHLERLVDWFKDNMPKIIEKAKAFGEAIGQWVKNIVEAEGAWRKFIAALDIPPVIPTRIEEIEKRIGEVRKQLEPGYIKRVWEMMKRGPTYALERTRDLREELKLLQERLGQLRKEQETPPEAGAEPSMPGLGIDIPATAQKMKEIAALRQKLNIEILGMTQGERAAQIAALDDQVTAWLETYGEDGEIAAIIRQYAELRYEDIKKGTEKAKEEFEVLKHLTQQTAQAMQQSMSTFFFDAITGELKTTQDYFRAFGRMMAKILSELMAKAIMTKMLSSSIGGWFGGGGGGLARGGMIQQGQVRPLPYIPQAQEGLMVARGRAVPIIAHDDEMVGTPARLAAAGVGKERWGNQGPARNYTINIQAMDAQSFQDYMENNRDALTKIVKSAFDDNDPIRRMG